MGRFRRASPSSVSDQPGDRNIGTGRNVTQKKIQLNTCIYIDSLMCLENVLYLRIKHFEVHQTK